jgi:hypothetical protein
MREDARANYAAASRKARDLELRSVLPSFQFTGKKEASSRSGKPSMWDRIGSRQFMDGSCRAAKPLGDVLDEQVRTDSRASAHRSIACGRSRFQKRA